MMPVCREESVLTECHKCMSKVLDEISASAESLYVNDGIRSHTLAMYSELGGGPTGNGRLSLAEATCCS